jgi:hypothetical protein
MRFTTTGLLLALLACSPAHSHGDAGEASDAGEVDAGQTMDLDVGIATQADGGPCTDDAGPPVMNCGQVLSCEQACASTDECCHLACLQGGTPTAQNLTNTLRSCEQIYCPSTDGGPCQMLGSDCTTCFLEQALPLAMCSESTTCCPDYSEMGAGGCCNAQYNSCEADGKDAG